MSAAGPNGLSSPAAKRKGVLTVSDGTALQPFDFKGNQVRVIALDGEPWFVAADVCRVLSIGNVSDALTRLDGDDIGETEVIDTIGRKVFAKTVNEPGLYELVIRSNKTEAKVFRRWITSEVLPSIRKTGAFLPVTLDPSLQRIVDLTIEMQHTRDEQRRQAQEIAKLASEAADHDARIGAIEGHHDWYAGLGYARLHGLPTSETWLRRLGTTAGQIGRANGLVAQKVPHARYGDQNSWPSWVWAAAVEERRAKGEDMLTDGD